MKKCEIQTNLDGGKISSLPLASVFLGPHAENGGNWEKAFSTIFADYMYWRKNYYSKTPFSIELLYNNIDTNLVCFFVRPAKWDAGYQEKIARNHFPTMTTDEQWTLEEINQLNKRIHERLTISPSREADSRKASLYQKFYVADTKVDTAMYCTDSMKNTLARFGYSPYEYQKHGMYVMRSTIMNPWYYHAAHSGKRTDYFMEFLEELHYAARKAIDEMSGAHEARLRRNHRKC